MISVSKEIFFDKPGIIARMDRKTHLVLSSTGAFSRTVMRRGMRRRKKISQPGQYPSAHAGQLKERISFGFDLKASSLVVGPEFLHLKGTGLDREIVGGGKTVPQLINEGGTVVRQRMTGIRGSRHFRKLGRPMRQTYRPRPFVDLTLPHAAAKLAENMEKFAF